MFSVYLFPKFSKSKKFKVFFYLFFLFNFGRTHIRGKGTDAEEEKEDSLRTVSQGVFCLLFNGSQNIHTVILVVIAVPKFKLDQLIL